MPDQSLDKELKESLQKLITPKFFGLILSDAVELYKQKPQLEHLDYITELKLCYVASILQVIIDHARDCPEPACIKDIIESYVDDIKPMLTRAVKAYAKVIDLDIPYFHETTLNEQTTKDILAELEGDKK